MTLTVVAEVGIVVEFVGTGFETCEGFDAPPDVVAGEPWDVEIPGLTEGAVAWPVLIKGCVAVAGDGEVEAVVCGIPDVLDGAGYKIPAGVGCATGTGPPRGSIIGRSWLLGINAGQPSASH